MVQLPRLSFPAFAPRLRRQAGRVYIYDRARRAYVRLQPEEWVRQSLLNYLTQHLGYPLSLIAIESMVRVNGMLQRADLVAYERGGGAYLLVECKAPHVGLGPDVVAQVGRYQGACVATYMAITNGVRSVVFDMRVAGGALCEGFPRYGG